MAGMGGIWSADEAREVLDSWWEVRSKAGTDTRLARMEGGRDALSAKETEDPVRLGLSEVRGRGASERRTERGALALRRDEETEVSALLRVQEKW